MIAVLSLTVKKLTACPLPTARRLVTAVAGTPPVRMLLVGTAAPLPIVLVAVGSAPGSSTLIS